MTNKVHYLVYGSYVGANVCHLWHFLMLQLITLLGF